MIDEIVTEKKKKAILKASMEDAEMSKNTSSSSEDSSDDSSSESSDSGDESPEYKELSNLISPEEVIKRRNEKIKRLGLDKFKAFKKSHMDPKVKEISDRMKRKDRTELHLSEWRQDRFYLRDQFLDEWIDKDLKDGLNYNIGTIHIDDVGVDEFMEKYEVPSVPVIIDGVVDKWPAKDEWSFPKLYAKYGDCKLRVGEDDDGYALRMRFK